ncbi:MAG: hypothetical protein AAF684_08745 [Pseudomonadota bacterium]
MDAANRPPHFGHPGAPHHPKTAEATSRPTLADAPSSFAHGAGSTCPAATSMVRCRFIDLSRTGAERATTFTVGEPGGPTFSYSASSRQTLKTRPVDSSEEEIRSIKFMNAGVLDSEIAGAGYYQNVVAAFLELEIKKTVCAARDLEDVLSVSPIVHDVDSEGLNEHVAACAARKDVAAAAAVETVASLISDQFVDAALPEQAIGAAAPDHEIAA